MRAIHWNTWERHLPWARVQTRAGMAGLCMKPWDQILPEEGIVERMNIREPFWRPWEKYLPVGEDAAAHLRWGEEVERRERVQV